MSDRPHLPLHRDDERKYKRRGRKVEPKPLPQRDVGAHGAALLSQLAAALVRTAPGQAADAGANAALDIASPSLADAEQLAKGASAYVDRADKSAVLYFPDSTAKTFRRKLERYSTETTKEGYRVTTRSWLRSTMFGGPLLKISQTSGT